MKIVEIASAHVEMRGHNGRSEALLSRTAALSSQYEGMAVWNHLKINHKFATP